MATHDYSIANQSFPSTRSDINNALSAIRSSNSNSTAPSGTGSTVAGQLFYDTANNKLQVATDADATMVDIALDSSGNLAVTGILTCTAQAVFNGGIQLNDDDVISVGTGDDLEIYHNGTNSIINDNGTGSLLLQVADTTVASLGSGGLDITGTLYASSNIGLDSTDYISFTGNTQMDVTLNGSNEFRFEADGDFHADGDVIAFSTTTSSDEKLKTGIHTVGDALDKVYRLQGVEFTWKKDGTRSAGVIAQNVEDVMPEAVKEVSALGTTPEHKSVNYNALHSLYIEAIKELKDLVDEQAQEIEQLKKG